MLFEMIDRLNNRIDKVNIVEEAPLFAEQFRKMRSNFETDLLAQKIEADQIDKIILMLSATQIGVIKGLPGITSAMSQTLRDGSGNPAFRCVVAASLAYYVQPKDLLDDNLPGCYGLIDDALLLHEACALSWEAAGDMARAEEGRKIFQFIFTFVPDSSREIFKTAVDGLATTLNLMSSFDPTLAEMTTQGLIANPLQSISSPAGMYPARMSSPIASRITGYNADLGPQYTWKDGDTMGVMFPGGGGVIATGRDIIPL